MRRKMYTEIKEFLKIPLEVWGKRKSFDPFMQLYSMHDTRIDVKRDDII